MKVYDNNHDNWELDLVGGSEEHHDKASAVIAEVVRILSQDKKKDI